MPRRAIAAVPTGVDAKLRPMLHTAREALLELSGGAGDPLQRAVRIQDLVDSGIALRRPIVSGGYASLVPNPSPAPSITPPQPTSVAATGTFTAIILDWDAPVYAGHSHAEILRSLTPTFADAEVVGIALAAVYQDYVSTDDTYYYWVRYVSSSTIRGPASAMASAARVADPSFILDQLIGLIDETHLVTTLNDRIDLIDGPDTLLNSVSYKVLQEANARIAADSSLNTAIINETTARTDADSVFTQNFTLLGAKNGGSTAWQLDASTVEVRNDADTGWVAIGNKFSSLVSRMGTAEADIISEASTRATADSAFASNFTLLGATALGGTVWDLDMSTVRVDADGGGKTAIGSRLTQIQSDIDGNTAAVATKASIATVTALDGRVVTIEAEYTVKIDINGYVTGYGLSSVGGPTGTPTSTFAILADRFIVGFPSSKWQASTAYSLGQYVSQTSGVDNNLVYEVTVAGTSGGSEPTWPTVVGNTVVDGSVTFTCRSQASTIPFAVGLVNGTKTVGINGDLVVDGTILARHIAAATITADKLTVSNLAAISANMGSITAGDITVSTSGFIKGGATGYLTGTGFWMGYSSGYKFSIGDPSTKYLAWNGSDLIIQGNIVDLGATDYQAGTTQIAAASTERSSDGADETVWKSVKQIRLRRKGTIRVELDYKYDSPGGAIVTWYTRPKYRILQGTTVLHTSADVTNTTYSTTTHDVTVTTPHDGDLYLEVRDGKGDTADPVTEWPQCYIRNVSIEVSNPYGEGAIVD